jgi:hypothetical protein
VIHDLTWICHLYENRAPDAGWFEVAVIHHTACGSGLFADPELRRTYARRGGYDEDTAEDQPERRLAPATASTKPRTLIPASMLSARAYTAGSPSTADWNPRSAQ